jgi:hypothetical protein
MRIQHSINLPVTLGLLLGGLLAVSSSTASAQTSATGVGRSFVPIHGLTGTFQEPINTKQMYDGVNKILVKAGAAAKRPAKIRGTEALENLDRGTPVVVHYELDRDGPNEVKSAEGVVTSIDRVHRRIGVQYSDGSIETLRLSSRAVEEAELLQVKGRRVVVSYSDDSGQKIAQSFKRSD